MEQVIILKISNAGNEFENTGSRQMRLLIGGSPCTHWSIAQKNNRETEPNGLGWELFKNFLIAKEKFKPDYFLYENNKSMAKAIRDQIDIEFNRPYSESPDWELLWEQASDKGHTVRWTWQNRVTGKTEYITRILINSALVSAQNRNRYYWTNIPGVEQPADRGILLKDILESGLDLSQNEKSYSLTTRCQGAIPEDTIQKHRHSMVAEPVIFQEPRGFNKGGIKYDKSPTMTTSAWEQNNKIVEPIRIGTINKGRQGERIYSTDGKGIPITANGGGQGGKTGLYACPVNDLTPFTLKKIEQIVKKYGYLPEMFNPYNTAETTDKAPTLLAQGDSETKSSTVMCVLPTDNPIYEVKNGLITIKDKQYPIKLPDGYYIIRKLTVLECKRLQTVRDNYIMPCSASQNYKMLGNGWTVDVIAHILRHIPGIKDCEVEVLSMYDGMSCGNLALEKLCCKINKYISYEIDKYAIQTTQTNFPYVIQKGDAFQVRNYNWKY